MMLVHKPVSLCDQIFARLEEDILTEKYPRDMVFTESELSEQLGVSRTPVREALRMLEQEHLIENAGKGMRVLGITDDDVEMIYAVREKIEGMAAALCAVNATDADLAELQEITDLQEFYAEKRDSEQVKALDSRFHEKIYRCSGSTVLYDMLMPMHKKIQKARKRSIENTGRAVRSSEEHRAVLDAIRSRDGKAAGEAMTAHVISARDHVRSLPKA